MPAVPLLNAEQSPSHGLYVLLVRKKVMAALLWHALLDQDTFWVPQPAWPEYGKASLRLLTDVEQPSGRTHLNLAVAPTFDVAGVLRVADMGESYRATVLQFLWRKTAKLCEAMSWSNLVDDFGPQGDMAQLAVEAEMEQWARLAADEQERRAWFDALPLVRALRA